MEKKLQNIVWKEYGYFVAKNLNTSVASDGNTKEEALRMLKEALELYFQNEKNPLFVPISKPKLIDQLP